MAEPGQLVLVRHGETEWSRSRQHTGRTDKPLTELGERQARALAPVLAERTWSLVLTSPLIRASRTAELAGLPDPQVEPDLMEWDYGAYEGLTSAEISAGRPGWSLWDDGVPPGTGNSPGETLAAVATRIDRVLDRARGALDGGDVALVAHGHSLRVVGARWLGLDPAAAALLALDTATLCLLGHEHGRPVLRGWNLPNPATG